MSAIDRTRPGAPTAATGGRRWGEVAGWTRLAGAVRTHWALLAVFAGFAASAFVVPVLAPVATTDDWGYARLSEILYHERRLVIFPVVAATAVFQIGWGALFAVLFGPTLGVFRLSTVVMVALGGWAFYGLCRQLGVSHGRSALGVAAYLFNPLLYVLAFTYMTDPHFVSLLVIATWMYARGLAPEPVSARWVVAGSGVAALAILTRQQGVLIPLGVVTYLLLAHRLRANRAGLALLVQTVALPVVATVGYFAWLRFVNDVPAVQQRFLRDALAEGWSGSWWLLRRLTIVELVYLGFFALPVVAAALPATRRLVAGLSRRGRWLFFAWEAVVIAGVASLWVRGLRMPYVGQFLGAGGPGAPDVLGSRPRLLHAEFRDWATIVCLVASLMLALMAGRALGMSKAPGQQTAGLVLAIGLWQVVGILPPSYQYIGWTAGSLDRYLLPLIPVAISLALWALRGVRLSLSLGWLVVAVFAIFATMGTRDYLVYMQAVWSLAREANAAGVSNEQLDAGSAWDGYHLYEYSRAQRIRSRTPKGGPWWVYFYAPATDSSYAVAGRPIAGYRIVWQREYSSWLEDEPTQVYLLRRPWRPWPPAARDRPDLRRPPVLTGLRWGTSDRPGAERETNGR